MIKGIHYTAISTPNLERLVAFYCDLLGFRMELDAPWEESAPLDRLMGLQGSSGRVALLRLGKTALEIFEFRTPTPVDGDPDRPISNHGITLICLNVSDLDSEYERLKAAGMRFHCPPVEVDAVQIRTAYGRDPDGNIVELQEILDPSSPMAPEE